MKQDTRDQVTVDREHLEMHLKIVAEERELNKKKIRRIGYLKFVVLSITKFLLSYFVLVGL